MKIPRLVKLIYYGIPPFVFAVLIYDLFTTGGKGGGSMQSYGNLTLQYAWHENTLGSRKIYWLVVSPEFPIAQENGGEFSLWKFKYRNGNEFEFTTDSKHLVWIDPVEGPKKIALDLKPSLIAEIEKRTDEAKGLLFNSPLELMNHINSKPHNK